MRQRRDDDEPVLVGRPLGERQGTTGNGRLTTTLTTTRTANNATTGLYDQELPG